jgi:hypothetical protein
VPFITVQADIHFTIAKIENTSSSVELRCLTLSASGNPSISERSNNPMCLKWIFVEMWVIDLWGFRSYKIAYSGRNEKIKIAVTQ